MKPEPLKNKVFSFNQVESARQRFIMSGKTKSLDRKFWILDEDVKSAVEFLKEKDKRTFIKFLSNLGCRAKWDETCYVCKENSHKLMYKEKDICPSCLFLELKRLLNKNKDTAFEGVTK